MVVVVAPPQIQLPTCIGQVEEHLHVQALVAQLAVEALDVTVLYRSARTDEVQVHTVAIRPVVEGLTGELCSVVDSDRLRCTSLQHHLVQRCCDLLAAQRVVGQKRHALARVLIDHRQHSYPTVVGQSLGHEVHRPLLVRTQCRSERHALALRSFLAPLCSHDQALLGIQPVDALGVHFPALALEKHSQPPVAVAHTAAGQLA